MSASTRHFTPPYPNGWFQVADSEAIAPGVVTPLRYFGRDLVAFRTEQGKLAVLDAHCPHLGAHLGHGGKVEGEGVVCPFHAWKFGADGELLDVPYAKRKPAKARVGCWTTKELAGLVMVWHHAAGEPPEWDIPDAVPEYDSDEWTGYMSHRTTIRTNNLDMAENQVDSAHFHYVHGATNLPNENPLLCDGDGPIGVFRRWCRQFYTWPEEQAAE